MGVLSEGALPIRNPVVLAVALDALSGLLPAPSGVEALGDGSEGGGEVRGRVENEREALHAVAMVELGGDRCIAHEVGLAQLGEVLLALVEPVDVSVELVCALVGVVGDCLLARPGRPVAPRIGSMGAAARGVERGVRLVASALEGGSFAFVATRVRPARVAPGSSACSWRRSAVGWPARSACGLVVSVASCWPRLRWSARVRVVSRLVVGSAGAISSRSLVGAVR